ncbi:peroxidase family protein [Halobellus ruber]|uniref:Peroxidase n=1 Tax=Halobellus ruber TaxID=2761102 RepID=A0A7J9SMK0_9EURY|nr:heme peroxidase family protein [Halobellus ruber]MBB6647369.1 peroxidase [Halobellus ruber]
MPTEHTVAGDVRRSDGTPAAGIEIVVVDADLGLDDPLGHVTTRGDGRFEVRFSADAHEELTDPDPHGYGFADGEVVGEWSLTLDEEDHELTVEDRSSHTHPMMEAVEDMHHGMGGQRGMSNVPRDPPHPGRGRFGRMFPHLEAAHHDVEFLRELGLPGGPLDEDAAPENVDTANVPAGFVFLGQFIDHDITLDPLSSLSRQNDPDAIRNFRTPGLDLDSVYGAGPEVDRFRYQSPMAGGSRELLLLGDGDHFLPRNHEDVALIADPRNDENLILSQFQYAMLNFHNAIVERESEEFERAQQLARWHYQWIVLEEYLPTVCDEDIVESVRDERRFFTVGPDERPFLPLEFAGAAYRFGHSQVRRRHRVNDSTEGKLFGSPMDDDALSPGFQPVSPADAVDWRYLFDFERAETRPQDVRAIDPKLSSELLDLPFVTADADWRRSLASRNLVRGRRLGLPSGQTIARAMPDAPVLHNHDVGFDEVLSRFGRPEGTEMPLWYYVLAEARELADGEHLGPVGSRIVAEVLVGLIASDTSSFLTIQPDWTPTLPAPHSAAGEFGTADLLEFALEITD